MNFEITMAAGRIEPKKYLDDLTIRRCCVIAIKKNVLILLFIFRCLIIGLVASPSPRVIINHRYYYDSIRRCKYQRIARNDTRVTTVLLEDI